MIYDIHALYSSTQAKQQQMAKHKDLSMNDGAEVCAEKTETHY